MLDSCIHVEYNIIGLKLRTVEYFATACPCGRGPNMSRDYGALLAHTFLDYHAWLSMGRRGVMFAGTCVIADRATHLICDLDSRPAVFFDNRHA